MRHAKTCARLRHEAREGALGAEAEESLGRVSSERVVEREMALAVRASTRSSANGIVPLPYESSIRELPAIPVGEISQTSFYR